MEYETRTLALVVVKKDAPIFDETATRIEIVDEAAGEFVEVSQCVPGRENGIISIEKNDWKQVRAAINKLISECRDI